MSKEPPRNQASGSLFFLCAVSFSFFSWQIKWWTATGNYSQARRSKNKLRDPNSMYQYSYAYPWPKPQTKTLRTFSLMACDGPTLSEVWENCKIKKMKNNSAFMGLSLFLSTLGGGPIKCSKKQWQQSDESTSGSVCFRSASSTTLKFPSHHSSKDILNILELDWDKDLKSISYTVCSTSANWDRGFTPKISSEGISCVLLPRVGRLRTHNRQRICLILGSLLRFIPVRIGDCLPSKLFHGTLGCQMDQKAKSPHQGEICETYWVSISGPHCPCHPHAFSFSSSCALHSGEPPPEAEAIGPLCIGIGNYNAWCIIFWMVEPRGSQ